MKFLNGNRLSRKEVPEILKNRKRVMKGLTMKEKQEACGTLLRQDFIQTSFSSAKVQKKILKNRKKMKKTIAFRKQTNRIVHM